MKHNYILIQNDVIRRFHIDLCDGTKCEDGDWSRMHAHIKERRVCKWKQKDTLRSTFDLFHEIGHIETTKPTMRRAESEYFATTWAIDQLREYGIETPHSILFLYQRYILVEIARGKRRGGTGYDEMNLFKYSGYDIPIDMIKRQIGPEWGLDW